MNLPLEVFVVSASPIYASALRQLLESGGRHVRCLMPGDAPRAAPEPHRTPDVLVIAPQSWQEMASWLPSLRRAFPRHPWLLLAEPRLVGMFLSGLETQPCALVPVETSPDSLQGALGALSRGYASHVGAELVACFARGIVSPLRGCRPNPPSPMELQCACAVSMGLSNRQIADLFHLGEATIKTHVHHLLQKLSLANRSELGTFVYRTLAHSPVPFGWK
jgi:DNA-binding NarL/FixJ family response regulator